MKRLYCIIVSITLCSMFVFANANSNIADKEVINKILLNSDIQIAPEILENAIESAGTSLVPPAPELDDLKDPVMNKDASNPVTDQEIGLNYFPIQKNIKLEYEYTSSEFLGEKRVIIEISDYSEKDNSAKVKMIIFKDNRYESTDYNVYVTESGITATDSLFGGKRTEIAFPVVQGKTWTEGRNKNRISSVNAKITVPAGELSNCIKITTKIGGGDAGSSVRYYTPGVGLVYEEVQGEDMQETIKLISWQILK